MRNKTKLKHAIVDKTSIERLRNRLPIVKQWYPSMLAVEGAFGIPRSIQQSAKDDGSEAFHSSGRVNFGELIRWIFKNDRKKIDWDEHNKKLNATMKQIEIDKVFRKVIMLDEAQQCVQELMTICFGSVKRMAVEFPKTLEMRSAAEIKTAADALYREILRRATAEIEKLKGDK
jgi:hypothetical protein